MLSERYALGTLVATGGMASVYKARDEVLARTVAVKILHPKLADDESFIERFRREALAAARLTHPNIVSIYDTGTEQTSDGERHFIVMEFCGGGTLQSLAEAEGPLDADRICAVGSAICDALAYAHANGVIHRDVKPGNVLLADDHTVKVSDFGIAKAAFTGQDLTTSGSLLGTVTYLSPEQAQGQEPDERSDIYSLGVVLYELAVGRPPFSAETPVATAMRHVKEPPPPPRSLRAGIPRGLESVILAALEKDPDDRPSSADELKARLTKSGSGTATSVIRTTAPPSRPAEREHHGDVSWVVRVLLLVFAVVVIALAATWLLSSDQFGDGDNERRDGRGGPSNEIAISDTLDFDPEGDDVEHAAEAHLAMDGDDATGWTTENYEDTFEVLGKSGVGLVFDLGESVEVETIEVIASAGMSIEIGYSDDAAEDKESFSIDEEASAIGPSETFEVGQSGRYWLIWITELPGGAGTGEISEVRFYGS